MTCLDGGEKAAAVGEGGLGANRNDGGTLTSNKLNRGPPHPAATQRNQISYQHRSGAVYDWEERRGMIKRGTIGEGRPG